MLKKRTDVQLTYLVSQKNASRQDVQLLSAIRTSSQKSCFKHFMTLFSQTWRTSTTILPNPNTIRIKHSRQLTPHQIQLSDTYNHLDQVSHRTASMPDTSVRLSIEHIT